jgi:hypothetical protein
MPTQSCNILKQPLKEEFNHFTKDLPSLEYQAACQYILIRPIRKAYHSIIHHLNYCTDFKVYPDDEMNCFEIQLRHSIRTRLSYLTQLSDDQIEVIVKAAAALKTLTCIRKILEYWNKTLTTTNLNIPIHHVPEIKQHISDKTTPITENDKPIEIIFNIYQSEIDKTCSRYHLTPIKA